MTLIKYVGGSIGTQSWYGVVSGKQYAFGLKKNLGNVDPVDLQTGKMQRPGLLEVRENGKPVFVLAPVADPEPSKAEVAAFVEEPPVEEKELSPPEFEVEKVTSELLKDPKVLAISVAAKKLSDEMGIDSSILETMNGSGLNGKITVRDVRKYLEGR